MISNSINNSTLSSTAAKPTGAISALDTVNGLLDLTNTPRPVANTLETADTEQTKDSFSMLAKLLQQGVVGTETYDVNGRPYTRFIETTIGDHRLDGLKPYRNRSVSTLDQRA